MPSKKSQHAKRQKQNIKIDISHATSYPKDSRLLKQEMGKILAEPRRIKEIKEVHAYLKNFVPPQQWQKMDKDLKKFLKEVTRIRKTKAWQKIHKRNEAMRKEEEQKIKKEIVKLQRRLTILK